jgi:hypothetical protein
MMRPRTLAVLALSLSVALPAYADSVTYWNNIIVNAATAGRGGPSGLLDIALAHAAVHDAVQVIDGKYQPYHYSAPQDGAASRDAAVAAAARRVLLLTYAADTAAQQAIRATVNAAYDAFLLANPIPASDPGFAIGEAAATALHAGHYRATVPTTPDFGVSGVPGQWSSLVAFGFLHLAFTQPFTMNRIDQFRPQPPPPLTSVRYARDFAEVVKVGSAAAHDPVNADSDRARFWSGNFVAQWNETARQLAEAHVPDTGERARLFALMNLAAADAAIAVWDSKYFYNFWRPVTAIPGADTDGNARTQVPPGWTPLFSTPPYPDYVSGANGLTGAFTRVLQLFFNTDTMAFTVKNPAAIVIDQEREFTTFSQAAQEVMDARVLMGIHFRFADEEGCRLGQRVAHWTFQKFLRPVPAQ